MYLTFSPFAPRILQKDFSNSDNENFIHWQDPEEDQFIRGAKYLSKNEEALRAIKWYP